MQLVEVGSPHHGLHQTPANPPYLGTDELQFSDLGPLLSVSQEHESEAVVRCSLQHTVNGSQRCLRHSPTANRRRSRLGYSHNRCSSSCNLLHMDAVTLRVHFSPRCPPALLQSTPPPIWRSFAVSPHQDHTASRRSSKHIKVSQPMTILNLTFVFRALQFFVIGSTNWDFAPPSLHRKAGSPKEPG